jgi:hypothetical protein
MATPFDQAVEKLQAAAQMLERQANSQAQLQAAGVRAQAQLLAQQGGLGLAQAQLTYLQTPGGAATLQQQAQLSVQQRQAQQRIAALQQQAQLQQQYGSVGAALVGMGQGIGQATAGFKAVKGVMDSIAGFTGKASPNTLATYLASWDMLHARVGTVLVPAVEEMSRALQNASRRWESIPGPIRQGAGVVGQVAAATLFNDPFTAARRVGQIGSSVAQRISSWLTGDDRTLVQRLSDQKAPQWMQKLAGWMTQEEPLKRSFKGLAQPQVGSAEDYYQRTQMEILGQGPAELDVLRTQMENQQKVLGDILESMKKTAENTEALRSMYPAFR